jgi:hypothetical protein
MRLFSFEPYLSLLPSLTFYSLAAAGSTATHMTATPPTPLFFPLPSYGGGGKRREKGLLAAFFMFMAAVS